MMDISKKLSEVPPIFIVNFSLGWNELVKQFINVRACVRACVCVRCSHRVNSFMQSLLQKMSFYLCLRPINNEDKMIPSVAVTA